MREKTNLYYSEVWETPPQNRKGHDKIVNMLKKKFENEYNPKYNLKFEIFNKEEAWIAKKRRKGGAKIEALSPHTPDIIISKIGKTSDRVVIEYVNHYNSFLRCLRGMAALSLVMDAGKFIVVVRNSVYKELEIQYSLRKYNLEIIHLKNCLYFLDNSGLDGLLKI